MYNIIELFEFEDYTVYRDEPLDKVLMKLNDAPSKTLVVVDEDEVLIGTITDGDARRNIISHVNLNVCAKEVCNLKPYRATKDSDLNLIKSVMRRFGISLVPRVNENGRLISILVLRSSNLPKSSVIGVLMAGGEGNRLGELTKDLPKPMIRVNGKPVIESLVDKLEADGITEVIISVRYKADKIIEFFRGKASTGATVRFLIEEEPLDTLGSLSLLSGETSEFVLVMHADLVHEINLREFIEDFVDRDTDFSIITKEISYQFPYGRIEYTSESEFQIIEKPVINLEVYVGIMILKTNLIPKLPRGPLNILKLLEIAKSLNLKISTFKTNDYWKDIGSAQELRQVQEENDIS